MAELGETIKLLRERQGLSQQAFAELAGVDQGNLSKIETGSNQNPTDDTLRRLANVLGITPDALLGLRKEVEVIPRIKHPVVRQTLRVGFPHTVWSAPLIAMTSTPPSNTQLCSYQERDSDRSDFIPAWFQSPGPPTPKRTGPSFLDRVRSDNIQTFTAAELVPMLERNEFDSILVATEVRRNYPVLIRCANILYSVGGPKLVVIASSTIINNINEIEDLSDPDERKRVLEKVWAKVKTIVTDTPATLFYSENTNAEDAVNRLRKELSPDVQPHVQPRKISLAIWGEFWSQHLRVVLQDSEFCLFVGWNPYIAWIEKGKNSLPGSPRMWSGYLYEFISHLPPLYLSLDLVFHKRRYRPWLLDPTLKHFLEAIESSIVKISPDGPAHPSALDTVAQYLDLAPLICEKELSSLNFTLTYDSEWYNALWELTIPA